MPHVYTGAPMLFPTSASIDWRSKSPIVPPLKAREFSSSLPSLGLSLLKRLPDCV